MRRRFFVVFLALAIGDAYAADPMKLTLADAVRLALAQNRALKIARLKVAENEQKKAGARADYFPKIKNESNFLHLTSSRTSTSREARSEFFQAPAQFPRATF